MKNMTSLSDKHLFMYTDGSYSTQSGAGAAAALILFNNDQNKGKVFRKISQAFAGCSSTQMELMAIYIGVSSLHEKCKHLTVYTDQMAIPRQIEREKNKKHSFIINEIKKELARKAETFTIRYRQSGCGNKFTNIVHRMAEDRRCGRANDYVIRA